MGLFSKKEKEKKYCPICGKETSFFKSTLLSDGNYICDDCVNRVSDRFGGSIASATLEEVKAVAAELDAEVKEALDKVGGDYEAVFIVGDVWQIAPKPLEVGLKRSKELQNKTVVSGTVQSGGFINGDEVILKHGGADIKTTVIQSFKNTGIEFETELAANTQKKGVVAGDQAWLILDVEGGVDHGDVVVMEAMV